MTSRYSLPVTTSRHRYVERASSIWHISSFNASLIGNASVRFMLRHPTPVEMLLDEKGSQYVVNT